MKWRATEIPPVRSRMGNYWDITIPAELVREMRLRPGIAFQLLTDDEQPQAFKKSDYAALLQSCRKPFRVQSRAVPRDKTGRRYVWVSFDPRYWEERAPQKRSATRAIHPKKPCVRCGIEFEHKRGNVCRDCKSTERRAA